MLTDGIARRKVVSVVSRLIGTSDERALSRQPRNTFREREKDKRKEAPAEPTEYKR
jgi:hypothetical protein